MAINARDGYVDTARDVQENFNGNQLVYVDWDRHRFFCAALAFPLPPEMPFGALVEEVIPSAWGNHPQFSQIKWEEVQWSLDGEDFTPNLGASLAENKVGHKSLIEFHTPEIMEVGDV